jgi:hypothetical protein
MSLSSLSQNDHEHDDSGKTICERCKWEIYRLTGRVNQLERAIRNHKKMVAAGRRYNIFLNDEAHKDLWSLVNDDFSASDQCD